MFLILNLKPSALAKKGTKKRTTMSNNFDRLEAESDDVVFRLSADNKVLFITNYFHGVFNYNAIL